MSKKYIGKDKTLQKITKWAKQFNLDMRRQGLICNPNFYYNLAMIAIGALWPVVLMRIIIDFEKYPYIEYCLLVATVFFVTFGNIVDARKKRIPRRYRYGTVVGALMVPLLLIPILLKLLGVDFSKYGIILFCIWLIWYVFFRLFH